MINKNTTSATSINIWISLELNKLVTRQLNLVGTLPGQWNTFQTVKTGKLENLLLATMVKRKEKCLNSRCSRMAKTKTFQLWCQLLMFSFLKFFIFDFLSYFSFFCTTWEPPCPPPDPLVPSHFTGNKNLIRSKRNIYEGRKKAQRLDNKMFHNKNRKISITNAQFTPKHRQE